ncbi:MAG TPA: PAS domain S-box protein [Nitrospira sp.]|jgi:PAS domain S-box-containing protein|nr:PAS domain S-box protein [Nitrospira sp.]
MPNHIRHTTTAAYLAAVIESSQDAIITRDLSGIIQTWNKSAERIFGYTAEEALNQSIFLIIPPHLHPEEASILSSLRKGELIERYHTVRRRKDGRLIDVELTVSPVRDADGMMIGVSKIVRDVTEREQARRRLAELQGLLSLIVASTDDAIVSKDLTGTITSWNRGAERIFGYTAEEMVGSSILRIIPADRHSEEAAILAKLRRGERIDHYETVRRKKDGRLFDISITVSPMTDASGNVIGASKIGRDISEQKRIERSLHESEARWRVTLESIGDAVVATDGSGIVTFANAVAAGILGRGVKDIVGRPLNEVFKIVHEETRDPVATPVDLVIRQGRIIGLANHTVVIRPDGTEVPIDDSAAPIRDKEDRLIGVVLVFRDISERKRAETTLQRWNAELEERVRERTAALVNSQERLRALASQLNLTERRERRRLAGDLHDYLAQLLALIRIKLGQALQRLPHQFADGRGSLAEIDSLLQQCLQYARTLMAQLSPSVLQDLGLIPALHWLAEQMSQQGLKVDVRVLTPEAPSFDEQQSDMLFQAVRELLTNVLKHAGVSTATVSVQKQDQDTWLLTVEDPGQGFDIHAVHYQPSGEHFGLFSIQERMEAMSGWCRVNSMPGKGTTVELGLAVVPSDPKPKPHMSSTGPSLSHVMRSSQPSRWRVLLVDDHAMVRQGLRSILETYPDLEVVAEAADGMDAVERALSKEPDVVVMDINLPRLNGIDATRRIKKEAPATVVIGLSVHYSSQTHTALIEAGASALLSKEQATEDLYRTITRFLNDGIER